MVVDSRTDSGGEKTEEQKKPSMTEYEGILTVLGVMLAIEYASEPYDTWDIFVGLLAVYIGGFRYWEIAKQKRDLLYSTLTASLTSLGIVTVLTCAIAIVSSQEASSRAEPFNFPTFVLISVLVTCWLHWKK